MATTGDHRRGGHRTRVGLVSLACAVGALTWAANGRAQTCLAGPGAVIETFPAAGSRNVPVNGLVVVGYCPTDEPLVDRSQVRLLQRVVEADAGCSCPVGTECVSHQGWQQCYQAVQMHHELLPHQVVMTTPPGTQLRRLAEYLIEAPELSGVAHISFRTGDTLDEEPPRFDGVQEVSVVGCGPDYGSSAVCPRDNGDGPGFVAILTARAAHDAAGAVNVQYDAWQVRGDDRISRGSMRGDGVSDITMSVFIPASELSDSEWERLCFVMNARDPYGQQSAPSEPLCVLTPEFSPFASACGISPARRSLFRRLVELLLF